MEQITEEKKRKTTVGLMFWVFIIVGSVISERLPLPGIFLIAIGFALGLIWLFRRFRKK